MSAISNKIAHDGFVKSLRPIAKKRVRKCVQYARMLWLMPSNHSELGHYRRLERWNWI